MKYTLQSVIRTAVLVTICIGLLSGVVQGSCSCSSLEGGVFSEQPLMHPDETAVEQWLEAYESSPGVYLSPYVTQLLASSAYESWDLLPFIDYEPNERDQGNCGNCWVWAGTAVLEVALDVEEGIHDRLSIQLLNSFWPGNTSSNWACCGGVLTYFADWYEETGLAIPWDNPGGSWADGASTCSDGGSVIPPSAIVLDPYYPIDQCEAQTIPTHEVGQSAAIAAIKNVLHQNRVVQFAFYMPNLASQQNFVNFWVAGTGEDIWQPDSFCGQAWVNGAGHAVACVGYDETNPEERYWIMLNSWGTTSSRPQGLFRMAMDMNYDCTFTLGSGHEYSFLWQTLDVQFAFPAPELDEVIAYPNPFNSNRSHDEIVFTGLTTDATISIYTISGELVRRFSYPERLSWHWDTRNEAGEKVARGTYLYIVTTPTGQSRTGKFTIINN